ncbi:MAG: CoA ester lyase [Pseudomonadota bacterium]
MPGSKARALIKARSLPADVLLLDLEDAVAMAEKERAREALATALLEGGYAPREVVIRVNGAGTPWHAEDLTMAARVAAAGGADAVLLPKVESAAMLEETAEALTAAGAPADLALWAMIETPRGILAVAEIAAHPRLACLVLGTNDLLADLRAAFTADRAALLPHLIASVLAARAHGLGVLDGVYNAFKDDEGLRAECEQGLALGMDGKTLIHPAQLGVANAVFAPSAAEVETARRQLTAFEAAEARGEGVAVVDGKIVENLHAASARRVIAVADAIAALEATSTT